MYKRQVESWERVFRICRSYGLNHMRFHSFCPPEAAFMAADRVGFYLQPEGPSSVSYTHLDVYKRQVFPHIYYVAG